MPSSDLSALDTRAEVIFREHRQRIYERTDRVFVGLLLAQWIAGIAAAWIVAPRTWAGSASETHLHVWAAIFLGGAITSLPVVLGLSRSGRRSTRHIIAVSQMLMSGLLIHLTGGRIETHFHVFGSLAFLAFYRDWEIFVPATLVVAADHFLRGIYWPESVYGVTAAPWRWLEHAGWVLFENVFLINSCLQSLREMHGIARQQAQLEQVNEQTERTVQLRTAELRTSEELFRSLSAASPLGIFQADPLGGVTYVNSRWAEIVGRTSADGLEERWRQCVHPEDLAGVLESWSTAVQKRDEQAAEFRVLRPDGDVRWVHGRARPMLGADGATLGYVGTLEDISDRKQAEARREADARTSAALARVGRELISSLETPVLLDRVCQLAATVLGADYSNTWLHQPAENVYLPIAGHGLAADHWEALKTIRLEAGAFVPLLAELGQGRILQLTEEDAKHPVLAALLTRHGAKVVACIPLVRGDDLIGVQIAAYRDSRAAFTAERGRVAHGIGQLASMALTNARLLEEVAAADRLKTEFVSTMSHELRTPLNVIIGYTEMLADDDPEQRAFLIGQIRRSSVDLLDMITATLDLGRMVAGRDEPQLEVVALRMLWEDLDTELASLPRTGEVALSWGDPGDVTLHTDRRKLRTILKNLIGNAIKFTPAGAITVECEVLGNGCMLRIRDTGVGIATESLPFIFDMFRQADSSETRSYGGVGLGLYIVRTLVTQLGGSIEVTSELGRGSLFEVRLPVPAAKHGASEGKLAAVG